MPTTIKDIARTLGLSHTTVSRVLNGQGNDFISEATRSRVLETAREMCYRPNRAARAVRAGRTHLVACWMTNLHEPYYAGILHQIQKQARGSGYDIVVAEVGRSARGETDASRLPDLSVDGILAIDFLGTEEALRAAAGDTPCITAGGYYASSGDFVGIDLGIGARQAVEHLVETGRRRIVYVVPNYGIEAGDARYDAYVAVMEANGLRLELAVTRGHTRADARRAVGAWIEAHGCPDALFCRNDLMAMGGYRALRERGIAVPGDVALVGCDGIEEIEYLDTPLSTIDAPVAEMAGTAWEFLRRRMDDPQAPRQERLLPSRLVVRESSRRHGAAINLIPLQGES